MTGNLAIQTRMIGIVESPTVEDSRWIEQAKANPEGFAPLFDKYYEKIYRYTFRLCGNQTLAEDLTADTFIKALQSIQSYQSGRVPFLCWLYRIAHNLFVSHYRKERVRNFFGIRTRNESPLQHEEDTIRQTLSMEETGERMLRLIRKLKPADQTLLMLRYFEDLPIAETAKVLQMSGTNARSRIHRALVKLQILIRDEAPDLADLIKGE